MPTKTAKNKDSALTAFVAMSYDERLTPVYLKVIEPVLVEYGYVCSRADEETKMGMSLPLCETAARDRWTG